jgi:hypothetical protein
MRHSVTTKPLGYEASAGWTTYGTSRAAFSLFQGVAARHGELLRFQVSDVRLEEDLKPET